MEFSRRNLLVFVLTALGLGWLVAAPLWMSGATLESPLVPVVATVLMFTPSIGVLVVWALKRANGKEFARATGLTLGPAWKRTLLLALIAWAMTILSVVVAIAVSSAVGLLTLDIGGLSLFRQQLRGLPEAMPLPAPEQLAIIQLTAAAFIAPLINAIPAFGEEWGWRGLLLPMLEPYGVWPALVLSGVLWGIWHAPLTLLGYNYPSLGAGAALMFIGFCVLTGMLMGALRFYSGSIWPAVIVHSTLNAVAGMMFLVGDAQEPPNPVFAGLTGLAGWVVLGVLAIVVFARWPVGKSAAAVRTR